MAAYKESLNRRYKLDLQGMDRCRRACEKLLLSNPAFEVWAHASSLRAQLADKLCIKYRKLK